MPEKSLLPLPLLRAVLLLWMLALAAACDEAAVQIGTPPDPLNVEPGCYAVQGTDLNTGARYSLDVTAGDSGYAFVDVSPGRATPFSLKPSGLGRFLLRDDRNGHLVSDGRSLLRSESLESDVTRVDDSYESDAEWDFVPRPSDRNDLYLRHRKSGLYAGQAEMTPIVVRALAVELVEREGCAEFPEAALDAEGEVEMTRWPDGDLFGFVDTHSHILSNFGFGGGGIFHGAPFHALGIEHALGDCERFHGVKGRKDLFGFGFDQGAGLSSDQLLAAFVSGDTGQDNHETDGWPTFTDWPSAHDSSTHQTQYYRWIERAWLGGLRLIVQHATTNQMICDLLVGEGIQPVRYACNDMVAVDRIIDETWAMQDYIDAQHGGPGRGFFRIVESPAEARRVIGQGKLAVILGIETSNLFDCFVAPRPPFEYCTEEDVVAQLDAYYDRGVRAIFPVHKYDNGFSAGDGDKLFIELGNFFNSGHWNNFVTDCDASVNTVFDDGPLEFPGLNQPRAEYLSPPPNDLSGYATAPLDTTLPYLSALLVPKTGEEVCQGAGLTALGETLIQEMMARGMILELDHLPRRSYKRAFQLLEAFDYPAAGTHGLNNGGALYALGGVSKSGFGRCRNPDVAATVDDGYQARIDLIEANGGYPAEGFGLDLNGFAGAAGPRFGPDAVCGPDQTDPVTYPFTSYAGDVTFEQPTLGERVIDFNEEGLAHVGLLPELIEDVRGDGVSDEELEPLFRSAEGYVRMWEKAELRSDVLDVEPRPCLPADPDAAMPARSVTGLPPPLPCTPL
jgi:microsomal dipeptidase-like Zn-dependent dipeptidase